MLNLDGWRGISGAQKFWSRGFQFWLLYSDSGSDTVHSWSVGRNLVPRLFIPQNFISSQVRRIQFWFQDCFRVLLVLGLILRPSRPNFEFDSKTRTESLGVSIPGTANSVLKVDIFQRHSFNQNWFTFFWWWNGIEFWFWWNQVFWQWMHIIIQKWSAISGPKNLGWLNKTCWQWSFEILLEIL